MTPEARQLTADKLVVVGDIHAQADKFWRILREAGLLAEDQQPSAELTKGETHLILLGDLVHAKTRASYAALIGQRTFDEHHPADVVKAETAQEAFLREVKTFCDRAPGNVTILLGNHDHNALNAGEGVLQTDTLPHYEWRAPGRSLPADLAAWLATWPRELVVDGLHFRGLHFAHVGPKPEHNRYDASFYLENRRDWILEPRDVLAETPYRFGVYGHTPVRGGVHFVSQGRALLLDMNGVGDEYAYLTVVRLEGKVKLELHGTFFSAEL